ncbi:MAG: HNH endonuclease [Firmicutes bacterium ADurb.Bin419]|nr:MAG: HNH endonuclease [Firmicutes bacterium ADurb.Bin419]
MFKARRIITLFTLICLILTVFVSSVSANTISEQVKLKATCKMVSSQRTDDGYTCKFEITLPNRTSSIGTAGFKPFVAVVHLGGNGTNIYATSYFAGMVNKYNLSLSLYNGADYGDTNTCAKREQLNRIGTILSPNKITYTPSSTKYWQAWLYGTIDGYEVDCTTDDALYNKKAVLYPDYTDPITGRYMSRPETTWVKVTNPLPNLTTPQRNDYKAWVEKCYNGGKAIDWTNMQIHHVKPREFGGTHDYSNLMPLKSDFHTKVTTWFANYR